MSREPMFNPDDYTADELAAARKFAAQPFRDLAASLRSGETRAREPLEWADEQDCVVDDIEAGRNDHMFAIAQRMVAYLTGECPPLLR